MGNSETKTEWMSPADLYSWFITIPREYLLALEL